jgi:hypothetical protein
VIRYSSLFNRVNGLTLVVLLVPFTTDWAATDWAAAQEPEFAATPLPKFLDQATTHRPMSDERFGTHKQELVTSARALERALGAGSQLSKDWKRYLKWDLLEPQLANDAKVDRTSLDNLAAVQRRFRSNHPGLELPVFTRVAQAIDRYRDIAFWHALAARRDTAPIYTAFAKDLDEQLRRHNEEPTMETTRSIGTALGTLQYLEESPELVKVLRADFSQPNILAEVSTTALNELASPVCQIRGVRDCILGATVRGTAITNGDVTFQPLESPKQIQIDMFLNGVIHSRTVAYKKPVKVHARGTTPYFATKRLLINDEQFTTAGLYVDANTSTRIGSIQKTGGKLGKRLIEKIARKKVYESKWQSERIASRHAEQKIAQNFDDQVVTALTNGRVTYEEKLRAPITRVALLTNTIDLNSTREAIFTRFTLASQRQIATNTAPPEKSAQNDVTLQLHETAVNNFLPTLLGGASLGQESADTPPKLTGDVPKWLRELSTKTPKEAAEDEQPPHEDTTVDEPVPVEKKLAFRPWRFTFNTDAPASVSFVDQKLKLRMRLAELLSSNEENAEPIKNWDFIVTYRIFQDGNEVVLERDGDIEVFPTGFDPRWDERLTSEQVGIRNNIARNLNRRAAEGQGFPKEIPLPAVKLPRQGDNELTLQMTQLDCDNGWLTIGYRVP